MAMHVWDGTSIWKPVQAVHTWDGSAWINSSNCYVWNSLNWVGFVDKITVTNDSVQRNTPVGIPGTASWELNTSGFVRYNNLGDNARVNKYLWCQNSSNVSQYEVLATWDGPALTGSALNTWLSLDTNRSWSMASSGDAFGSLDITIRNILTQQTFDAGTITLNVISLN